MWFIRNQLIVHSNKALKIRKAFTHWVHLFREINLHINIFFGTVVFVVFHTEHKIMK